MGEVVDGQVMYQVESSGGAAFRPSAFQADGCIPAIKLERGWRRLMLRG